MALLLRLHENARVINNTNLSLKLKCAPHNDTEASAYIYYSSMICTTLVYITFASVYPYSLNSGTFGILNYTKFLRSHPLHYKLSLHSNSSEIPTLHYITIYYEYTITVYPRYSYVYTAVHPYDKDCGTCITVSSPNCMYPLLLLPLYCNTLNYTPCCTLLTCS